MKILQADLAKSTTSIKVKNTTISRLLNAIRVNLTQIYATDGFEKKRQVKRFAACNHFNTPPQLQ